MVCGGTQHLSPRASYGADLQYDYPDSERILYPEEICGYVCVPEGCNRPYLQQGGCVDQEGGCMVQAGREPG